MAKNKDEHGFKLDNEGLRVIYKIIGYHAPGMKFCAFRTRKEAKKFLADWLKEHKYIVGLDSPIQIIKCYQPVDQKLTTDH